MLQIPAIVAGW